MQSRRDEWLMHIIDPVTRDFIIFTGDGETVRIDPETAAYLLSQEHRDRTVARISASAGKRTVPVRRRLRAHGKDD